MRMNIMTCDICGRDGAKVKHVPRTYGKGDELVLIEGVPVVVCPNCGHYDGREVIAKKEAPKK